MPESRLDGAGKSLDLLDKINILEDFNEGCELTDAVHSLLSAADTLMSYGTLSQVVSRYF